MGKEDLALPNPASNIHEVQTNEQKYTLLPLHKPSPHQHILNLKVVKQQQKNVISVLGGAFIIHTYKNQSYVFCTFDMNRAAVHLKKNS